MAGRVYEMSGTTTRHNQIVFNVLRRLDSLVPLTPYRVYFIDIKIRAANDRVYYPDVVVVCLAHTQDAVMFDSPCFIVEVTSRSTRRTDRVEKLDAYLKLPSLHGYLVIEQDCRHATLYQRESAE